MGRRIWNCPNRQYAEGFLDGIEFVNDSAIKVERCVQTHVGTFVFTLEDDDFDGMEAFLPSREHPQPTAVALEQLRDDSEGRGGA